MSRCGGLRAYHRDWLSAHPNRSEEWLREKLREGFDVHHIDGDRQNNDPSNLVLIEHADHMMLHTGRRHIVRLLSEEADERAAQKAADDRRAGKVAHELRRAGFTWADVAFLGGFDKFSASSERAKRLAGEYARKSGIPLESFRPRYRRIQCA